MNNKIIKVIFGSLGGIVVLIFVVFIIWVGYFFFVVGGSCENEVLESANSPGGSSKVVTFVRNCGATTDWTVHASLLDINKEIDNGSTGNLMSIGPNHGKAWPLSKKGWPIIIPEWRNTNSVILHYSQNAEVFFKESKYKNTEVSLIEITKDFADKENLEIRK